MLWTCCPDPTRETGQKKPLSTRQDEACELFAQNVKLDVAQGLRCYNEMARALTRGCCGDWPKLLKGVCPVETRGIVTKQFPRWWR